MSENEKIKGQLLDDDALEDVSGGSAKILTTGNVTRNAMNAVHRTIAGSPTGNAATTVLRSTGGTLTGSATSAVLRTPTGARDKDGTDTTQSGRRIVSV